MTAGDILRHVPLFTGLSAAELDSLGALVRSRHYAAGQIIFHEGDEGTALFIIEKGEVKIVRGSTEGKEVALSLFRPGEVFGELALIDGERRSADAVAKETSQLLILEVRDFRRFVTDYPQVALNLLKVLSQRLRRTDEVVADSAFLDVRGRLVKLFLDLARQQKSKAELKDSVVIASRLTQTDLANRVLATRESVNRWVQYYIKKDLIHHDRGRLTLLDVERLQKELY